MFSKRLGRWRTTLIFEMPSSPDTLRVLLTRFAEVMKVTNHTGFWDDELTWFSPSATRRIYLNGFEHGLGIHSFRLTWPGLIIKVLTTRSKFLQPSGYCTVINSSVTFNIINVFVCFWDVITQFAFVKHKFPNYIMLHVYLRCFQITHWMKQCKILSPNYLPLWVPTTARTASVTWNPPPHHHQVVLLVQSSLIPSLTLSVPIIHRLWQIYTGFSARTDLMYVSPCWLAKISETKNDIIVTSWMFKIRK